jgi:hypothetical protein
MNNGDTRPMPTVDVDRFWEEGYAVLRGVFTPKEVLAWREAGYQNRRPGDLLSKPELRSVILDDRVLFIAGQLLGTIPTYFGDSACNIGDQAAGFHKDNPDKEDQNGPDWKVSRYPIIRMGLYCQDHKRNPGGLDLRARSHLSTNVWSGSYVYADTTVGDLVVWTLRTSHSGSGIMLRLPRVPLDPASLFTRFFRRLPRALQASQLTERMGIFMTFASESPLLERYIRYLRTREYAVNLWRDSAYGSDVWTAGQDKPVKIRDMRAELERDPPTDVRKEHRALAY